MGRGPKTLPPDEPAVTTYRQTNRRQGDIFEKKNSHIYFDKSTKKNIKIKKIRGTTHDFRRFSGPAADGQRTHGGSCGPIYIFELARHKSPRVVQSG